MARFTSPSISGYNASPPPDDGTQSSANQLTWAKHKTKLADPVKTLSEAVASAVESMDGFVYPSGITTTATNLTLTVAAHNGKNIRVTGSSTITLPEAASASTTFRCVITKGEAANTVTVNTQNSETIDGASSVTLTENGESIGIVCDGSNFFVDSRFLASNPLPRNYVTGFEITKNGTDPQHDIDIAAGEARDDSDNSDLSTSSSFTKQINAVWAEGTGQGGFPSGLNSGVAQADTVYNVLAIVKADGTVDFGFDTSTSGTNLLADATDYSSPRVIGQVTTDSSSDIKHIWQRDGVTGTIDPVTTTSGTSHTVLGVPSWVKQITLTGIGVSLSGTEELALRLGDSGGIETTGYDGRMDNGNTHTANSTYFQLVGSGTAASSYMMSIHLRLIDSENNRWSIHAETGDDNVGDTHTCVGTIALDSALDRIQLLNTASDTFDAGTLYGQYSG